MAQKIKHGRQAIDRLSDGLRMIHELIVEIAENLIPPNIRLIQRNIQEIITVILDLRQFVDRQLDPMLQRREIAQTTDELAAQVAAQATELVALAAEVADLRDRLAVLERSHVHERSPRKGGDA